MLVPWWCLIISGVVGFVSCPFVAYVCLWAYLKWDNMRRERFTV